jgi:hypothetical protein
MAVDIDTQSGFRQATPDAFEAIPANCQLSYYDVSPDGERSDAEAGRSQTPAPTQPTSC